MIIWLIFPCHHSSISTCRRPVQAKLPSLQLKVKANYFLPVKYISNLVVIVDRFLSKACVRVCLNRQNQCFVPYNRRSWVKTQTLLQITILTTSFGNCLFVYHLVLKHLFQNVIRSSFCIQKVIRIGAYKGANYSPKITILVNLGTLLNKVIGPQ